MRYLPDVLLKMIECVPDTEIHLMTDLAKRRTSAVYSSPEDIRTWWNKTALTLEEHFKDPNNLKPWQEKIVNIFMDKPL